MASSLPLSPRPSSSPRNWTHHVFPSFHGLDVRKAFLSHVMKEFRRIGIDPFIDNDIVKSKSIGPELIKAIKGSRVAIVLFSKNYASSTWCLDELVEILKCRKEFGQIVMIVFYEVDPTDVEKQTGDFGKSFRKTCKNKTKKKIGRWRKALVEAATIAGEDSKNWDNDAKMIEKIANDVSNELNISISSSDFDGLVGMESHMKNIEPLLEVDSDEVKILGFLGPPGIGKTTIARFLFDQHFEKFQMSAFMENIKGRYNSIPPSSDDYIVKKYLQKEFMSQITNQKDIKIPHLGIVKDRLKDKKVLVVLDDVDQLVQLEAIVNKTRSFGSGSRIIVTTQDQKILKAHDIKDIYMVNFPSSDTAFEMFCMYAFLQKFPKDGFKELALEGSRLAGNLPLGQRVMGSYFRGMSKQDWKIALPTLKTRLNGEIENILKLSYDALCDEEKKLYLHIACFFNHYWVDLVECCLANTFSGVTDGLRVLAEKSLISVDSGIIKMHDLFVKLGREIVRKKSDNKIGKRQFLVDGRDIDEILNGDQVDCSSVLGIHHSFSEITCTSERAFERFSNLQFLYIDDRYFNMGVLQGSISRKLIFLFWRGFPMRCLPSNFHTEFLVHLYMSYSKLEKLWEGLQPLSRLKGMYLSDSKQLKEVPDLSSATNLQELNLSRCSSLVKIPTSIGNAINLKILNLSECFGLVELPFSIWNAINLQELDLSFCSSLVEIPSFNGNFHRMTEFDFKECSKLEVIPTNINLESPTKELDPHIRRISRLRRLVIRGMKKLVSLPQLPYSLLELHARDCESLERLDCIFRNPDIELDFSECFKLNQETRDLIIHRPSNRYAVLPGREVPACFTYRATGSFLKVKLNQNPLCTSTKFKACLLLENGIRRGRGKDNTVYCYITSKQNALTTCISKRTLGFDYFTEHLYIFEVEVEEVTSTELDFEFNLGTWFATTNWMIKECAVFQLEDGDEDYETSDTESSEE